MSRFRRWRWPVLAFILLAAIVVGAILAWRLIFGRLAGNAASAFEPRQPGEFLIVIAPFYRQGGDPQPIGGTLAAKLSETLGEQSTIRLETLARAPRGNATERVVETYQPHVLITGEYDGQDIDADVLLIPPDEPPPAPQELASGASALFPPDERLAYHVYASQALAQPLSYLEAWAAAQGYFWQGEYEAAGPLLLLARQSLPRQAPLDRRADMDQFMSFLNWQLGIVLGPAQGNWQAARDMFDEAARQDPSNLAARIGLAAAYAKLGNTDQAIPIIRQTLRDAPNQWQPYLAAAELALSVGDTNTALAHYDFAINLLSGSQRPTDQLALADIYVSRGYYHLTHNAPDQAASDFQKAVDLGRNDAYVQSNLAWASYLTGDQQTAIQAAAAARELAPDRPDIAFNYALALLAAGRVDDADTAYNEAITLTLTVEDVITRSTYFGVAYNDLQQLATNRPDLAGDAQTFQERIDVANG